MKAIYLSPHQTNTNFFSLRKTQYLLWCGGLLIISVFLFSLGMGPIGILSGSYGVKVLAQETELPNPGLTPDSPFYFLETITEEIVIFFNFGDLKKAARYAVLAAERVTETQAVVEKGKPEFVEKTLQLGKPSPKNC